MERKKVQPTFVWNKKRATSMLLLGLSILLLVYVVNIVVKLVYLNNEANELRETLQSMIDENHKTQGDEIIDGDMIITVYDNNMTDGENVYSFPKD